MIQDRTSSWASTTIGDVVDVFDSIRIPLNSGQRAERQGPYPYYGASGVIDSVDDFLFNGEYVLVAEDGENLNSRNVPVAFMACGKFWVNNHAHIIKGKPGIADDRYLIAWFANANISGYITGTAQPKLSQGNLKRIELRLPPLPLQRKIASILSVYDDLIENNTRRIAILEEMAQAIYREWFVNFRFPGHENVKLVDSPLGQIPEGWEVVSLASLMAIQGGSQPPKSTFVYEPTDGYIRLIQIRDYQSDSHLTFVPTTNKLRTCDERDILIARYGASVARICWGLTGAYNVALAKVIPEKPLYRLFLKSFLMSEFFQQSLIGMSGRAAQNGFNKGDIAAILLARPIKDYLLERYSDVCFSMETSILNLRKRNERLRTTRDLLLPKLISGKLDVEDLDIDVGMTAEALEEATA